LQTVAFPASVQTLGKHCFLNCLSLVSVVCEAGSQLASVGVYAFRGCSALQAVTLPSKVKTFGERCFASCPSLTSVMCEAGSPPAEIGEGVFESSLQARFAFSHDGEQDEASSED
jgi:hypothetical protein